TRRFARHVQVTLGYLAGFICMDDQQPLAAEFRWIFLSKPIANILSVRGIVHHHEQNRLLVERLQLLAVLLPAFDARSEISLIPDTRDVRPLLGNPLRYALKRAFYDVIYYRLLERIIEHRPGEELALAVPRRGREIELGCEPARHFDMKSADHL